MRSFYLIKLIFYNPFSHIFIVTDPYIAGTAKHEMICITTNIQAITQTKIFNRLGAFAANNIYIHKTKLTMTSTIDAEATDTFFIIANHKIASTE